MGDIWPGHMVHQLGLQEQVSSRQQVVTDQILIGSHGHIVTDTQGTQDVQHLPRCEKNSVFKQISWYSLRKSDLHDS